ncbi:hypothetical protein QAD02_020915 [Eretmocerus hayati]|uniref:Uncharacterized protein n=1 Tax=Eretmocerus hayati TaxID=131215 RepID=A0ACC2PRZ3_9HYME|nr:hypothetical protein QAD02_020915 [Eretmocerus hayati]
MSNFSARRDSKRYIIKARDSRCQSLRASDGGEGQIGEFSGSDAFLAGRHYIVISSKNSCPVQDSAATQASSLGPKKGNIPIIRPVKPVSTTIPPLSNDCESSINSPDPVGPSEFETKNTVQGYHGNTQMVSESTIDQGSEQPRKASSSPPRQPFKNLMKPITKLLQLPITKFFRPKKRNADESPTTSKNCETATGLHRSKTRGDGDEVGFKDPVSRECTLSNSKPQRESFKNPTQPPKFFQLLARMKKDPKTNQLTEETSDHNIIQRERHDAVSASSTSADPVPSSTTIHSSSIDVQERSNHE